MENFENMDWEAIIPPENAENEMKQIQKSLRNRNLKIVLTSLVLVVAFLLGSVYGVMPLVETFYWSPTDSTLDQYDSDLRLVLQAYTELFLPGKTVSVLPGKTGFAEYELHMTLIDSVRGTKEHFMGRLFKGKLGFDMEYFDRGADALFRSVLFPEYPESAVESNVKKVREKLESLPEYIRVEAAVTFPEDITMAQLLTTMEYDYIGRTGDLTTVWAAIRTQEVNTEEVHRCVGISFTNEPVDGGINELYPEFKRSYYKPDGSTLETHFMSLLQFSSDMMLSGKAVLTWHEDHNFYQEAISYCEENGVKAYGSIVTGTPETLLALLDSGDILDMELIDAWIDVA